MTGNVSVGDGHDHSGLDKALVFAARIIEKQIVGLWNEGLCRICPDKGGHWEVSE